MLKMVFKVAWTYDAQTGEEAEQTVTAALRTVRAPHPV